MKRILLPDEKHRRRERVYVYAVGIGFLLIVTGFAIKVLWSL